MAWAVTAEAVFYALAAALQFALAGYLLLRPGRKEWAWVLAALFAFNGGVTVVRAIVAGVPMHADGSSDPLRGELLQRFGRVVWWWLEPATSVLLAYLFLVFPEPPAWGKRHPVALRAAILAPLAALWGLAAFARGFLDGTPQGFWPDAARNTVVLLPPAAAWCVVLVRGPRMLVRAAGSAQLHLFGLVLAAVAMRAAHAPLLQVLVLDLRVAWTTPASLALKLALAVPPLVALGAAFVVLLRPLRTLDRDHARLVALTAGMLVFGALLAFPFAGGSFDPDVGWGSFLTHWDLYVVRPVLVLGALLPDPSRRTIAVLAGGLAVGSFGAAFTGFEGSFGTPVAHVAFSLVVAVLAAAGFWIVGVRVLAPAPQPPAPEGHVEAYLDALERAFAHGAPDVARAGALAAMRQRLGVTQELHDALERAVRRQGTAKAEWEPTDFVLGRYEVACLLGEGSYGRAYLARDILAGRDVVLKRMTAADPRSRQSLLLEASVLRRLRSPRIVEHLRTERGGADPVLVLEHMPGGSLEDRLRSGPLPVGEALALADDVLAGLADAHAAGVVHRDLKPSNILFGPDGRAKVADFGAAAPATQVGLTDATVLAPSPGSLRYMSPEQVRGAAADPRADLYSLAVTLVTALDGANPFEGRRDEFEVRKAILEGRVRLPPSAPPGLRRVLRQALAVEPEARPASADAMRAALREAAVRLSPTRPPGRPPGAPRTRPGPARTP